MQRSLDLGEAEARLAVDTCVAELRGRGKAGVIATIGIAAILAGLSG